MIGIRENSSLHTHVYPMASTSNAGGSSGGRERASPDYTTQMGAEELLAHAYANYSPPLPLSASPNSISPSLRQGGLQNSSIFGLLDAELSIISSSPGDVKPRSMTEKILAGTNLSSVGSQDPRRDVVKAGVLPPADAEILVD
jgi:hypothetical protein